MPADPPAYAHGPLQEICPDVFVVTGTMRFGPGFTIPRNMTVLRRGDQLTVVNSVRLSPEGEAALDRLGRVTDVVRLGGFHGMDDPHFQRRYSPKMWAPGGLPGYEPFGPGQSPTGEGFVFTASAQPEAALITPGGLLITCDAFQNWTKPAFDACSIVGRLFMRAAGFQPAFIGKFWLQKAGPGVEADFRRLLELPFDANVSGHGEPLREGAREALRGAVERTFRR